MLLKYLGERGRRVTDAALSTPPRRSRCRSTCRPASPRSSTGLGPLYQHYFLRRLRRKVRAKRATLNGHVDVDALLAVRGLRDFDDLVTAPLHGFADSADYYRRSSSKPFLPSIRVPTLLLHAVDDPFLPAESIPHAEVAANPLLEAIFPAHGGHVGFVAGPPWAPVYWAERTAAAFLARRLAVNG